MTELAELNVLELEVQRRRDLTFLAVLFLLFFAAAAMVVKTAYPPHRDLRTASGKIRAVDPTVLRNQLRERRLSKHEALNYRRVDPPGREGVSRPGRSAGSGRGP